MDVKGKLLVRSVIEFSAVPRAWARERFYLIIS